MMNTTCYLPWPMVPNSHYKVLSLATQAWWKMWQHFKILGQENSVDKPLGVKPWMNKSEYTLYCRFIIGAY